jgi:hypothetical protein
VRADAYADAYADASGYANTNTSQFGSAFTTSDVLSTGNHQESCFDYLRVIFVSSYRSLYHSSLCHFFFVSLSSNFKSRT